MASKKKKGSRSKGGKRTLTRTPPKRPVAIPSPKRYKISIQTRVKLREGIELLRKHIKGYGAADGYSLKTLDQLDSKKRRSILRRAAKLKELTAVPHDTIKTPTRWAKDSEFRMRKERRNLNLFTKQRIRGAKHYIVHKPADNFHVRLDQGNVEIEGRFAGQVISRSAFYLFPRRPKYPKELVAMARKLLKEMRLGFYTILTAAHGDTGEPFERDQLINRLDEYLAAYEVDSEGNPTGFSEALVGFRWMSTSLKGAVVQRRHIDQRRQRQKVHNENKRKKALKQEREKIARCEAIKRNGKRCRNRAVTRISGRNLCATHAKKAK